MAQVADVNASMGVMLETIADSAGVPLCERLPVYVRYVDEQWLGDPVLEATRAEDDAGERFRSVIGDNDV